MRARSTLDLSQSNNISCSVMLAIAMTGWFFLP